MSSFFTVLLIGISLSMDAFSLAISYGILKIKFKYAIITAITVGIFHFFMPLLGNFFGNYLFLNTFIKPKLLLFFVFLFLSISMFINFFKPKEKTLSLNIISSILFAISVSIDSFSVGIGIEYLYSKIFVATFTFLLISSLITMFGFWLGRLISKDARNYAYILGGVILFLYAIYTLFS